LVGYSCLAAYGYAYVLSLTQVSRPSFDYL